MTPATETTLADPPIFVATVAAVRSGALISLPDCGVCADAGVAPCHCGREVRREVFAGWFAPPVHGRDGEATTVMPAVEQQREAS